MNDLLTPRQAATVLGVSYPTLKQWIYKKRLRTSQTAGGHHRISQSEIAKFLPKKLARPDAGSRENFRQISGRNQLVGRIIDLKVSGLLAQVTLSVGGQQIKSIVTADAVREMRLKKGETAAALIKATEVMILRA